ncbi:MAG: S-adenosylmethionine:tRNA ribosyltransferase-isomerase [Spirosomataceae bacterium]
MNIHDIQIADYTYHLPDERIARFPLSERDQSKLLVYRQGHISHSRFDQIGHFLPPNTLLVFNNTKVIPARLLFQKSTGAVIEIFLLHPVLPTPIINLAMEVTDACEWECMIGNRKRWKKGEILTAHLTVASEIPTNSITLRAEITDEAKPQVRFSWDGGIPFVELVKAAGLIPLPPYLKREVTEQDKQTYQTVFSEKDGAVAAPTAGLHFTKRVLQQLTDQGIGEEFLTLHVGAGTFQPVKVQQATEHTMHSEQVVYSQATIQRLLQHIGHIIPVGTTSMRALESLYWVGVHELRQRFSQVNKGTFFIQKLDPYQQDAATLPSAHEALNAILDAMQEQNIQELIGETEIMILPGYPFQLCTGLITNFHQPGSTLMLLVAALVGEQWKTIYTEALQNDYRFLSYGDSSLLMP